jgi:uncharacterized protein (DUF2342 family)
MYLYVWPVGKNQSLTASNLHDPAYCWMQGQAEDVRTMAQSTASLLKQTTGSAMGATIVPVLLFCLYFPN